MSFRPSYFGENIFFGENFFESKKIFAISEPGFLDNFAGASTAGLREILINDENGNLSFKIEPKKREKTIFYAVKSGENISKIAHKFGLKISTILWANDLNAKSNLPVGKKLKIPPLDGIFYSVKKGDTLSEIAKNHGIDLKKILAYNFLPKNKIAAGDEIFLPDAQKIFVRHVPKKKSPKKIISRQIQQKIFSMETKIRRPTKGILTQGFHRKHFAIDIANKLNTPIYAAAGGKIVESADGWNYGLGKYIIIDHGKEIFTVYAHLNKRKTEVGAEVKTGQLIGLMGNTGNVFGPTGIHLHFELRIRGRKVDPRNYFN